VIRAPTRLSRCQDLEIDMSGSYGTAGRPLNYTYGIFPNVPNDNAISDMLFGWSQQQKIDTINLPSELFEAGVEYRFAIYVTSFLRVYQRREHLVPAPPIDLLVRLLWLMSDSSKSPVMHVSSRPFLKPKNFYSNLAASLSNS
jgi:hypothetical protein